MPHLVNRRRLPPTAGRPGQGRRIARPPGAVRRLMRSAGRVTRTGEHFTPLHLKSPEGWRPPATRSPRCSAWPSVASASLIEDGYSRPVPPAASLPSVVRSRSSRRRLLPLVYRPPGTTTGAHMLQLAPAEGVHVPAVFSAEPDTAESLELFAVPRGGRLARRHRA